MMNYKVIRTLSCDGYKTECGYYTGSDINAAFKEFQTCNNETSRSTDNDPNCHCAFDILQEK